METQEPIQPTEPTQTQQVTPVEQPEVAPQEEEMMSPEVIQWFKDHPTPEAAQALSMELKRGFIQIYYTEEAEMDEAISKGLAEAEDLITKEIASGKNVFPFSEPLAIGLIEMAKLKSIDVLIAEIT